MNEDFLIEGRDKHLPLKMRPNDMRRVLPENGRHRAYLQESSKNEANDFNTIEDYALPKEFPLVERRKSSIDQKSVPEEKSEGSIDQKSERKLEGKAKSMSGDGEVYIVLYQRKLSVHKGHSQDGELLH